MCALEQASADDGLLPLLSLGGQPVQSLTVFTTQLLPETHQQLVHLLMVSISSVQWQMQVYVANQPVTGHVTEPCQLSSCSCTKHVVA